MTGSSEADVVMSDARAPSVIPASTAGAATQRPREDAATGFGTAEGPVMIDEAEPSDAESLRDDDEDRGSGSERGGTAGRRRHMAPAFRFRRGLQVPFKLNDNHSIAAVLPQGEESSSPSSLQSNMLPVIVDFKRVCIELYGQTGTVDTPPEVNKSRTKASGGAIAAPGAQKDDTTSTAAAAGGESNQMQNPTSSPPMPPQQFSLPGPPGAAVVSSDPLSQTIRSIQARLQRQGGFLGDPWSAYRGEDAYDKADGWLDDAELFDTWGLDAREMREDSDISDPTSDGDDDASESGIYFYQDPSAFQFDNSPSLDAPLASSPAEEGKNSASAATTGAAAGGAAEVTGDAAVGQPADGGGEEDTPESVEPRGWRKVRKMIPKGLRFWFERLELLVDKRLSDDEDETIETSRLLDLIKAEVEDLFDAIHVHAPNAIIPASVPPPMSSSAGGAEEFSGGLSGHSAEDAPYDVVKILYRALRRVTTAVALEDLKTWWHSKLVNRNEAYFKDEFKVLKASIRTNPLFSDPQKVTLDGHRLTALVSELEQAVAAWQAAASESQAGGAASSPSPPALTTPALAPSPSALASPSPAAGESALYSTAAAGADKPPQSSTTSAAPAYATLSVSLQSTADSWKRLMQLFNTWKTFLKNTMSAVPEIQSFCEGHLSAWPGSCWDMAYVMATSWIYARLPGATAETLVPRKFFEDFFKTKFGKVAFHERRRRKTPRDATIQVMVAKMLAASSASSGTASGSQNQTLAAGAAAKPNSATK